MIKHMEDALQALAKVAPWLAAKTKLRKEDGDEDEYYKIVHHLSSPELVVKDYAASTTDSFPSMQELQAAKFPSSLLSESLFAPRPTLAASEDKVFPNLLLHHKLRYLDRSIDVILLIFLTHRTLVLKT